MSEAVTGGSHSQELETDGSDGRNGDGESAAFHNGSHRNDGRLTTSTTDPVRTGVVPDGPATFQPDSESMSPFGAPKVEAVQAAARGNGSERRQRHADVATDRQPQPAGVLPWFALLAGVGASLAANVAAAEPTVLGRAVAGWSPLALLLSFEMLLRLGRDDMASRTARVVTVLAVVAVAAVAAVVSYEHMREVAERVGEGWRAYLLPISVDGMILTSSMVLLSRAQDPPDLATKR